MKRTLFRILAFPLPTRNMRNYVRRLGGPKIIPPAKHITDVLYASIDIAGVPRARGFMRYVQQANLRLLWAFDKFATENHLEYFMIGGAIAGLIRYSACVPWDDDIDVGMTAENYTKFLQLIRKTLPNNEYSLMLTSNVFRIVHNKTKAFLDILRYGVQKTPDCYKQDGATKISHAQNIFNKTTQNKPFLKFYATAEMSASEISQIYAKLYNQHTDALQTQNATFANIGGTNKTIIPLYTDCKPSEFYGFNTIFPVSRKKFDKYELYFPNDPELYATKCWGDIWKFPPDLFRTHEYTKDLSPQKLIELRKYLAMSDDEIYNGFTGGTK